MNTRHEQNILIFSACGAFFFAVLALVWGTLAHSQMIMFDGVYSFLSLLLTGLYFYAAKSIAKGRSEKFPYGRMQIEPLVIIIQSTFLIVICIKAFCSAAISLFSTIQEINNLSGMGYASIGVFGCLLSWAYIKSTGKKRAPNSDLIKTQCAQWLMDMLLSVAVLVGFSIGYILELAGYVQYAKYMDPIMVVIAVLFFVRRPVVSLIDGIKGTLLMAPEKNIYESSNEAIKLIAKRRGFQDFALRIGKSGRELIYEVSFIADNQNQKCSIGELDEIRAEVENHLNKLFDNPMWLHVSFVHDRNLI